MASCRSVSAFIFSSVADASRFSSAAIVLATPPTKNSRAGESIDFPATICCRANSWPMISTSGP